MDSQMAITIRMKKIGVLLRDARISAGKSKKDCGEVLGVSSGSITSIETGRRSPSLPELERLSFFLKVPFSHFYADEIMSEEPLLEEDTDLEFALAMRDKVIGKMLAKLRDKADLTYAEIHERTGITSGRMRRFENGEVSVPVPELEVMCSLFGIQVYDLVAINYPSGKWVMEQRALADFRRMPPDLQDFITKPVNRPYLELAQRLSSMSAEELRGIAEGLLEITI
jgi:transcriptional regulator with XRE-family HTH domain